MAQSTRLRGIVLQFIIAWAALFVIPPAAIARLGETVESFRSHTGKIYKFKNDSRKDNNHYYMFSMLLDAKQQEAAPGVAAGITLTTVNGRITGESMAVRLGDGSAAAKLFGLSKALEFAYSVLGKPASKNSKEAEAEFSAFSAAAEQALFGLPQNIRYRGYSSKITLSRTAAGDLVVAITPEKRTEPTTSDQSKQNAVQTKRR